MSEPGPLVVAALAGAAVVVLLSVSTSAAVTVGVVAAVAVLLGARWLGERRRRQRLLASVGRGGASWDALEEAIAGVAAESAAVRDELARLEPWRERLVTSIDGPALLFSADERLLAANDAARRVLAIPSGTDVLLVQALGSAAFSGAVREAKDSGRPVQVDAEVRGRSLRATASSIADEVLVIVADRTEQRRVEALRRDFVVNASHELKTPVTGIQALADALSVALANGSERAPALVERLQEESERMVRMVHDLLDLRRLEDEAELARGPVDLVDVVRDVLDDLRQVADEVDVRLVASLPEAARTAAVHEDLTIVVHNLVSNAVRYNRPGGCVEVELVRDGGDHVLRVADTGIGIPKKDLQRVFERFYRVDVARSRERGGTGLGLSLVRHAVEQHGGSVTVDSLLGTGSTFTVHLPVEPVA